MDLGDTEPLLIHCDPARPGAFVVLDPDADGWFTANTAPGSRPELSEIFVLLSWAEPGPDSGQVVVRAGDRRVGGLTAADIEDFRSALDQGSRQNRPVITEAGLERIADAGWRLTAYRPSTSG